MTTAQLQSVVAQLGAALSTLATVEITIDPTDGGTIGDGHYGPIAPVPDPLPDPAPIADPIIGQVDPDGGKALPVRPVDGPIIGQVNTD